MLVTVASITSSVDGLQKFFAGLDWSRPSWDMFIYLFFIIATLLYGLSLGRDRVIVILISVYMALAVVDAAPFLDSVRGAAGADQFGVFRVAIFAVVFILLFFLMSQSALLSTIASTDTRGAWWQVIVFSMLQVGLLISIVLSFLPAGATTHLAPMTQKIFVQDTSRFLWIIAPIVAMILLKGAAAEKRRKRSLDIE